MNPKCILEKLQEFPKHLLDAAPYYFIRVSSERIEEIELREWCRKFLAPHQVPMEFVSVDEIEKLQNGKVRRKLGGVAI